MGLDFDWGNLVESGLGILFPPLDSALDQGRTDEALQQQTQAADEARAMMGEQWQYLRGLNDPIVTQGDYALQGMRQGIAQGNYLGNENAFNNYSVLPPSQYNQQGRYTGYQQSPGFTNAPDAVQYDASGLPKIGNTGFQGAPTLEGQRDYNYNNERQPGQYAFDPYSNADWNRDPGAFSYNQQQPQFSPYQQQGQQPGFSDANYWKPEQFNVGDDPVYQRALSEANRATESSAAAKGMQLSGATLKGLQENAAGLANEYGQEAFNRYVTQQGMQQQAQNYQNEDIYGRQFDQLGQYNLNRQFGQTSNLENAAMGNQIWNTGFQNELAAQGQNYGQYAQNRAMGLQDWQANIDAGQYQYGVNLGQYNTNRDYYFNQMSALTADDLNRYNAQANQYNTGRNYDLSRYGAEAGQYNQNLQNQLAVQGQQWQQAYDPYLTQLGQFNANRAFDYGAYQDYGNMGFDVAQYNNQNNLANNLMQYQVAQDAYNRSVDRGQTRYGMQGDLVNLGMGARQNMGAAAGDYWGSTADIAIGQSNAYAAAMGMQNQDTGLLESLL